MIKSQDHEILQQIHELGRNLETGATDGDFSEALLSQLSALFHQLEFSENTALQKIAKSKDHLHPQMSLRHLVNFLVPVERFLDRHLNDGDFLISEQDQTQPALQTRRPIYFVLDNLRSAFNVGSIFRLADCVGASEILLCGYTAPITHPALQKASMKTSHLVPSRSFAKVSQALEFLQQKNIPIVALETVKGAILIHDKPLIGPMAFVVGNERFGLDRSTLQLASEIRSIPVFGVKNSLNVANSLSIAAFEWSRQNPC